MNESLDATKQECLRFWPDDPRRVELMSQLVTESNQLPAGDYIEVGVHWGISLKLIHRSMDQSRRLYGFDTFDGFDQRDLDAERNYLPQHYWTAGSSDEPLVQHNFWPTSLERVREFLGNPPNLELVKGWFPDSFKQQEQLRNSRWRFIHLDVDLYQPTMHGLRLLWRKLLPGGLVLVHDYALQCFAAGRAVDEFCRFNNLPLERLSDFHGSALLRKPA